MRVLHNVMIIKKNIYSIRNVIYEFIETKKIIFSFTSFIYKLLLLLCKKKIFFSWFWTLGEWIDT